MERMCFFLSLPIFALHMRSQGCSSGLEEREKKTRCCFLERPHSLSLPAMKVSDIFSHSVKGMALAASVIDAKPPGGAATHNGGDAEGDGQSNEDGAAEASPNGRG